MSNADTRDVWIVWDRKKRMMWLKSLRGGRGVRVEVVCLEVLIRGRKCFSGELRVVRVDRYFAMHFVLLNSPLCW